MIKKLAPLVLLFLACSCQNQSQVKQTRSVNSDNKQNSVASKVLSETVKMFPESEISGLSQRYASLVDLSGATQDYHKVSVEEVIKQLKENSVHCLWVENVSTKAMELICHALQTVTNPVRLFVVDPNHEQMRLVAELVKKNASLSYVKIISDRLNNESAKAFNDVFCEALKVNTKLEHFCFTGYLDNENAKALGKALRFNTSLEYFTWEDGKNNIGAKLLLNELKNNKSLKSVKFENSHIDDDGIVAISDWLKTSSALKSVTLRSETMRLKGIKALSKALNVNTSLTDLNLSRTKIDDNGIAELANGLKQNKTLMQLEIPRNYHDVFDMHDIGPKGINALVDMRKVNKTTLIQLGPKDYETLEKALKDSKIAEHKIHTVDDFS